MCELFALSSSLPTRLTISLDEFARHAGGVAPHQDGWGIAFYEGYDIQRMRESLAMSRSAHLSFLKQHQMDSSMILAHIRWASQGEKRLFNTQPFTRELGGRMHSFVHNGDIKNIREICPTLSGCYRPIGDTDSEILFCYLLEFLQDSWRNTKPPSVEERFQAVWKFAQETKAWGSNNFLYSDGEFLFAHGHRRIHERGEKVSTPPGLHFLCRTCVESPLPSIEGLSIQAEGQQQRIALVASVPLSQESWRPLEEGELLMISQGVIVKSQTPDML